MFHELVRSRGNLAGQIRLLWRDKSGGVPRSESLATLAELW